MIKTKDREYTPEEEVEGKTIKKFDNGYEEVTLLFEDGTYHTIMTGTESYPDI